MSYSFAEDNSTVLEDVIIDANDISMYYKDGTRLNVDLYDSNNDQLANQSLTININSINYSNTTNNDGKASIAINLAPGKYLTNN